LAGAAAVLLVTLGTTPSFATPPPTWSVSPGGTFTGAKSGRIIFTDTATKRTVTCLASKAMGKLKSGRNLPGADIGTITTVELAKCTGPGNLAVTIPFQNVPWNLSALEQKDKGITTGEISRIHATFSASKCTAILSGTSASDGNGEIKVHYNNSKARIATIPTEETLRLFDVNGCTGLFKTGDSMTLTAAFKLTPAQTITES
jgi:hypothetical protein